MSVETVSVIGDIPAEADFTTKSAEFVKTTVVLEAFGTLKGYFVSDKDADAISNAVGDTFVAHYNGDEDIANRVDFDSSSLGI